MCSSDLQGIKRGIMEMADGIVINKADGNNVDKARMAATHFRNALHFFPVPDSGWTPKVLTYSGFYGLGIKEIWNMIDEYIAFVKQNGYFEYRRNEQAKYWMYETINEQLKNSFLPERTHCRQFETSRTRCANGENDFFRRCQQTLGRIFREAVKVIPVPFPLSESAAQIGRAHV